MSGEKTEQPTPKRLRDARMRGQILKSQEIPSTALLVALGTYIWVTWESTLNLLKEMIVLPADYYSVPFHEALGGVLIGVGVTAIRVSLPFLGVTILVGIAANYFQVGPLFVLEPLKPELKKLNPVEGLKKIFSKKNLFEFLKQVLKVAFLSILLYMVIRDSIPALIMAPYSGRDGLLSLLGQTMKNLFVYTCFAYVAVAAADYFFQRWQYNKELMMSKAEVKQEYKEMEGDPHIKSKRKQLHKEMVMNDTMERTRKSSVLITNPTHIAIAVFYDKDETPLPVVMAKGTDHVARRMIEVAQEEGIPILQNVPLARDLFEQGDLNQYIPSELIQPVAEVLRWVQQLKRSEGLSSE